MTPGILTGIWTYRSWLNDPALKDGLADDSLLFGSGYIRIDEADFQQFKGEIYGPPDYTNPDPLAVPHSWGLKLTGSINYGNPYTMRFEGRGLNMPGPVEWNYDYLGYLVNNWVYDVQQPPTLVGTIVRTIPHLSTDAKGNNVMHPAGVTCTWYAVKYSNG